MLSVKALSISIMAQQNTTSAGQPLFIVDRDWLRQGPKARKSWTGNVRSHSLYGLAIQVTDCDVPEKGNKHKKKAKSKRRRLNRQDEASDSEGNFEHEQAVQYAPPVAQTQPDPQALGCFGGHHSKTINASNGIVSVTTDAPQALEQMLQPSIRSAPPGFEQIKGLECYLDYCKCQNLRKLIHCANFTKIWT